jgi:negative regulator of replication initiation
MVSQSSTTSCKVRASSKIRSISAVTSARQVEREFDLSMMARLDGLLRSDLLASDMSAITRVMIILKQYHVHYVRSGGL